MIFPKPSKTPYLKKALKNLSLVVIPVIMIYFAFRVFAGSLSPGAPPAATMRTLQEIYNALAGTFDSSATTRNYNGSAVQLVKCIANEIDTGVSWYKTGGTWGYREAITIDHTKVSNTNQTNFPVLVSITDTDLKDTSQALPGHVGQSDGGDILFTSSNGTTKLSHEIEKYDNTTGNLIAWVKVPVLSASVDTVIYLYYGNASIANQWDTANVWDSNYKMVQHLSDATTSTTTDSTSNANNGTKVAANEPIETSSGQINEAQSFDGGNDIITINDSTSINSLTGTFTILAWVNPNATQVQYSTILSKGNFSYYLGIDTNLQLQLFINNTYQQKTTTFLTANVWTQVAWVHTGSTADVLYFNGAVQNYSASGTYQNYTYENNNLGIGNLAGFSFPFNGSIDEVRISSTARSADWIVTEYNNQSSPSTFYTLGSEESFGC